MTEMEKLGIEIANDFIRFGCETEVVEWREIGKNYITLEIPDFVKFELSQRRKQNEPVPMTYEELRSFAEAFYGELLLDN